MRLPATIACVALVLLAAAAQAKRVRPPAPYTPVAVKLLPEFNDAGLAALRTELAAVANGRIYAELARPVVVHGLFWERDFANAFNPRRPSVDNLAAALRLEHRDGAGWRTLAALAAEAGAVPLESRPGIVCAPGPPTFDGIAFDRLIDTTFTDPPDWAYPRVETLVREKPRTNAVMVERLGLHFVRVLPFEGADGEAPSRAQWAQVVVPSGKTGFVAPGTLMRLNAERLCYGKDATGRWRIAGYIGGGD
jgi:hypothetical protein